MRQERTVDEILKDPATVVGISVVSLFEISFAILQRTESEDECRHAVAAVRLSVEVIAPVTEAIVEAAFHLRLAAKSRIAIADCLIAGTAICRGAILVHRDLHFASLAPGKPIQDVLLDKV